MIVKIHPINAGHAFYCKTADAQKLLNFVANIGIELLCCDDVNTGKRGISYVEFASFDEDLHDCMFRFCTYEKGEYPLLSYGEIMTLFSGVFWSLRKKYKV